MASRSSIELGAAASWAALGAASAALLVHGTRPAPLVAAGAVLGAAFRETDRGGWTGFLASAALRAGDATLAAGIAWYLASRGTPRGAMTACAAMTFGLIASYVRLRARALGVSAASLRSGGTRERSLWLAILALGIWAATPDSLGVLVGACVFASAWSVVFALARGVRIWRSAPRG